MSLTTITAPSLSLQTKNAVLVDELLQMSSMKAGWLPELIDVDKANEVLEKSGSAHTPPVIVLSKEQRLRYRRSCPMPSREPISPLPLNQPTRGHKRGSSAVSFSTYRAPSSPKAPFSAPLPEQRPLSDGPMAHTYVPLSARPVAFESFLPIDDYPRERRSMLALAVSVCASDIELEENFLKHTVVSTPGAEHAMTVENSKLKPAWYTKGTKMMQIMFKNKKEKALNDG